MINNTETPKTELRFNSADYPLSQMVVRMGDETYAGIGLPSESEMRKEALKYMGREALNGAAHVALATVDYIGRVITHS